MIVYKKVFCRTPLKINDIWFDCVGVYEWIVLYILFCLLYDVYYGCMLIESGSIYYSWEVAFL